jgi:hypothetical protein
MDREQLERRLRAHRVFAEIDRWTVTGMAGGITSPHTYRFQLGDQDYFVKEVKANEKRILRLLSTLGLEVAPKVVLKELLEEDILVAEHISGEPLKSKKLPPALIRNYAEMQNVLNRKDVLIKTDAFAECHFVEEDDGFYRRSITRCLDQGYRNLLSLQRHDLPAVEAFIEIADHVRAHRGRITDTFSDMPFAWLHHDFREAHIVGDPPKLLDWGSSYGHGPFLFDLAPFLFTDREGLRVFVAHSDICRNADPATIERWLYAATCAGLGAFLMWHLGEFGYVDGRQGREPCRALLAYELPAYEGLLTRIPF